MTTLSIPADLDALADTDDAHVFVLVEGLFSRKETAGHRVRSQELIEWVSRGADPTWDAADVAMGRAIGLLL